MNRTGSKPMPPDQRRERRLQIRLREGRPTGTLASVKCHGHRAGYVEGCRCDACTDAEADYSRRRDRSLRG